jgi:hypothetical protein
MIVALLIILGWRTVRAQATEANALLIMKAQTESIAQDVVKKLQRSDADSGRVVVRVEARTNQTMVENAFVDVLGRSVLKPLLAMNPPPGAPAIDVLVLGQTVDYREIPDGAFERTVKTVLEARYQAGGGADVEYLGTFQRSSADTVLHQDEVRVFGRRLEPSTESASFFDKIAGPVLIITGAFLIVYLFFTVRN